MEISIDAIRPEELGALQNLTKMYCYEWSQYNLMDVDEQGVYPFEPYVRLYLEKPRRHAFFARVDGVLAGFALIDDDFPVDKNADYAMAEFFVMHKYRRSGVGRVMAETLFDRFRGAWEVGFHPSNTPSVRFWPKVIGQYTHGNCTLHESCPGLRYHDGALGSVLTFCNREDA